MIPESSLRASGLCYTLPMPSYAAFLGHQPRISIAELAAVLPDFALDRILEKTIAIFRTSKTLTQADLTRWGGTFLLAQQIGDRAAGLENVPQVLAAELKPIKGKVTFAIRAAGVPRPTVRDLYRKGKELLKKQGRPSRYVGNERIPAATALLHDAGLVDGSHGVELVILKQVKDEEEFLWIGKTVGAQDPTAYAKRDMEKPVRDTRAGLLPPKLAQVLINFGLFLSGKNAQPIIYDPFCGTGVIAMEALLQKLPVAASDIMLKAVNGCEKNLEWMRKQADIKKRDVASSVWKHDATKPFDLKEHPELGEKRTVIVTESHLGPALAARPNAKEAAKMRTENEALQIAFLKNVAATLPGTPIVITWPVWYLKTGPLFLEKVWQSLPAIGFNPTLLPYAEPDIPDHFSLLYRRPDQLVGREIVLLKPTKK